MDLPHYDLDSLVYLSSDIVIADLSKDANGNFTATVTEALYGALQPGEKLEALTPFLMFFQPLNDGQKVILFLDRRPHKYDFFHQDAAKSPFAVPPSGVYLIDEYGHVHEYFQQNNPGPYVAQGYRSFPEYTVPTEKDDLARPSLDEVKARIDVTVKSVMPIRALLVQPIKVSDVPVLMKLLTSRPRSPETCTVGMNDVIALDIAPKISSLNDPNLLLRIWSAVVFLQPSDLALNPDRSARVTRVKFLLQALRDRKIDASLRITSLQILSKLSNFYLSIRSGPSPVPPSDYDWLASSADKIVATAKAIFKNRAEDPGLRALSLRFLHLDNPHDVAEIRRVYSRTRSPELQFAIEQAFLEVSDELYQSLHPSSGPVASIIQLAPDNGCVQPPDNQITFRARFYSTRVFNDKGSVVTAGRIVLKNIRSGQSYVLKNVRSMGGYWSILDGVLVFALQGLSDFSAGTYTLGMEYAHQFNHLPSAGEVEEVPSVGHTVTIAITDSSNGKHLSIRPRGSIRSAQPAAGPKLSEPTSVKSIGKPTGLPPTDPNLNSVVYTITGLTFPGAGPQHTETFQFTAPNFIISSISLSASRLDSCVNCIQSGTAVQFFPNGTLPLIVPADSVHFTDADGIVFGWVFSPGAFSATGTYTAFDYPPYIVSDVATMTVRAVRSTPEQPAEDAP